MQEALVTALERWTKDGHPRLRLVLIACHPVLSNLKLARRAEAKAELEKAARMATNARERDLLVVRAASCVTRLRSGKLTDSIWKQRIDIHVLSEGSTQISGNSSTAFVEQTPGAPTIIDSRGLASCRV